MLHLAGVRNMCCEIRKCFADVINSIQHKQTDETQKKHRDLIFFAY